VTEYAPLFRHRPPERWTNGDLAAKVGHDLGLPPDDEQRELLDMIYAEKAPDRPAAFEVCVVGPRQNIKTSTLGIAAIADMFVFGVRKHLWSAHLDDTAKATFQDFKEWIGRNPDYDDACRFYEGHQDRSIVHEPTGNRIDFGSRTGKGKRGLTGVQRVTLDEALYLEPKHVGAVYPTMLTRPGAQVRVGSSAGLESSVVLRGIRDRGRSGKDPRLAYVEYGAPVRPCEDEKCLHDIGAEGCALDDRSLWWHANCALWCGRIGEEALADQRRAMAKTPEEFMREFFSWWEDPLSLGGAFSPDRWGALVESFAQPDQVPAIGLGGTPDGLYGSIGAAAVLDDGRVAVAPVDRRRGQKWLVAEAARIQSAQQCAVVVAKRGPLAYLIPDLVEAGVDVTEADSADWVDACEGLWRLVEDAALVHPGDKGLTESVLAAPWRTVGDRRAFGRKGGDISLLEAVTLAAWKAGERTASVYESRGALTL
jgi:hypothetical protein